MPTLYETMIKIGVDTSEVETGMGKAEESVKGFGGTAKDVFLGNALYDGIKKIGGAILDLASSSIETGLSFDKAMSQVQATMLKTNEQMEASVGSVDTAYGHFEGNLREFAQFLGENTAFSATQAAEALNYMALAGYNTQESMDMLPSVLSLAAAGNFDLARASDMVTDAQTAFGIDAERTAKMVDEMAKAASTGNTSVEQLGDAFLVVGGLAKELNGGMVTLADGTQAPVDGIQELEIALTAMANAGVKGSSAGTHIRNMIMKLSSPTKEGAAQMEALGVSVFDAEGNMRSLQDIMGDLNVALGGLTQEQKLQAISDLFNARDLASANALLGAIEQDWNEIGESILHASDNSGAAAEMAQIQLDNLAGDMTLFKSASEGAQIAISDKLSPALRTFVQGGTGLLSTFTEVFKEQGLQGVIDAGIEMINNLANSMGRQLPKMVPVAMNAIVEFSGGLRKNVGNIVDAGLGLITTLADALISNLPVLIQTIPTIVSNIAGIINDNAPKLLMAGAELIMNLVQGIIDSWPVIVEEFPKIIKAILDVWTAVNWVSLGTNLIKFIVNGVKTLASAIPNAIKSIGEKAFTALKSVNWLSLGRTVIQFILNGIRGLSSGAPTLLKSIGQKAFTALKSVNWLSLGRTVIQFILNGIRGLASSIPTALKTAGRNAMSAFRNISWGSLGSAVVSGIARGISNGVGSIISAAKDAARSALQAAKDFLGVKSPSRVFRDEVGKMISLGLAQGISDNAYEVEDAAENLAVMSEEPFDSFTSVDRYGALAPVSSGGDTFNISVYGVQSPEEFVNGVVRELKLRTRMA